MENIEYQYEVLKWHRQQILKKKVLTNNDHDIRYRIEHLYKYNSVEDYCKEYIGFC